MVFFFSVHQNISAFTANFSGQWCWEKNNKNTTFFLELKKKGDYFIGGYHFIALNEHKLDENSKAFNFKDNQSFIVQTKVVTSWKDRIVLVQLKLDDNQHMEWTLIKQPFGEFFLPRKAILYNCREQV